MASLRPWIAPVMSCLAIQAVWFGLVQAIDLKLLYQSGATGVLTLNSESMQSDGQSDGPSDRGNIRTRG
jgi:hypothetical protein